MPLKAKVHHVVNAFLEKQSFHDRKKIAKALAVLLQSGEIKAHLDKEIGIRSRLTRKNRIPKVELIGISIENGKTVGLSYATEMINMKDIAIYFLMLDEYDKAIMDFHSDEVYTHHQELKGDKNVWS